MSKTGREAHYPYWIEHHGGERRQGPHRQQPIGHTKAPPLNESAGYVTEHATSENEEPTRVTAEPKGRWL